MEILIALLVVIVLMVIAVSKFHFHPFLSLLLAGIVMGFIGGLNQSEITGVLMDGFGKTLGSIGIIIAFGTIIGAYLEKSGGASSLAAWVLKVIGKKRSALAMNITGYIVSIPVYCDSGFIILSSLNKAISKRTKIPLVVLGISLAAGLYATHVLVPPTPGPLAATAALNANLGLVLILGIIVAGPVSLAGFVWAKYIGNKVISKVPDDFTETVKTEKTPEIGWSLAPILTPIVLIALKSLSNYPTHPFGEGIFSTILDFIGNPVIALFIGVFLAFKLKNKNLEETHMHWIASGLKDA
ncbi:MAG: GntP family permease, partial [Flavobacteriaceae bacterium]|nr:GntP family permease [Flavobacteriaceae bacterium]